MRLNQIRFLSSFPGLNPGEFPPDGLKDHPRIIDPSCISDDGPDEDPMAITAADCCISVLLKCNVEWARKFLDLEHIASFRLVLKVSSDIFLDYIIKREGHYVTYGFWDNTTNEGDPRLIWKIQEDGAWKPVSADASWVNTTVEDSVRQFSMIAAKGAYYNDVWTREVSLKWSLASAPDAMEDHTPTNNGDATA